MRVLEIVFQRREPVFDLLDLSRVLSTLPSVIHLHLFAFERHLLERALRGAPILFGTGELEPQLQELDL